MEKSLFILVSLLFLECALFPGFGDARSVKTRNGKLNPAYDTENYSYDEYPTFNSPEATDYAGEEDRREQDSYNYNYDEYPELDSDYVEDDGDYADDEYYNELDNDQDDEEDNNDKEESMNNEEEIYGPTSGDGNNHGDNNDEYDDAYDEQDYDQANEKYENEDDDDDYEQDYLAEVSDDKSRRPSARVVFKAPKKVFDGNKENIMFSDDA